MQYIFASDNGDAFPVYLRRLVYSFKIEETPTPAICRRRTNYSSDGPAGIPTGCVLSVLWHESIVYSCMQPAGLRLSSKGDGDSTSGPCALIRLAAAFTVNIGVLCSCLRNGTVPTITSSGSSMSRPGPDCVATNCTNEKNTGECRLSAVRLRLASYVNAYVVFSVIVNTV